MVLGAQLWPLSAIFDLRRLAARTRREHGNDVVCPLLLTSEINERYSLPFLCPTREFSRKKRRVVLRFCDICKSRLNLPFIEESGSFVTPCSVLFRRRERKRRTREKPPIKAKAGPGPRPSRLEPHCWGGWRVLAQDTVYNSHNKTNTCEL